VRADHEVVKLEISMDVSFVVHRLQSKDRTLKRVGEIVLGDVGSS
jgi:hypothetical protein